MNNSDIVPNCLFRDILAGIAISCKVLQKCLIFKEMENMKYTKKNTMSAD